MQTISYEDARSLVREEFAAGRVRAGLKYLNGLTPHRFSGLFLFDDPVMKNVYIVDKENPQCHVLPDDIPQEASYCAFARNKGGALSIENALEDDRVSDHPARSEVISYCGIPLQGRRGEIYGTMCHYDYCSQSISDQLVWLMEEVAPALDERRSTRSE